MSVYQDSIGNWIFFDGITKYNHTTEGEAQIMASNAEHSQNWQDAATELNALELRLADLHETYFVRNAKEPFDDSHTDGQGYTAAELVEMVTYAENFLRFHKGDAGDPPILATYGVTLDKIKAD